MGFSTLGLNCCLALPVDYDGFAAQCVAFGTSLHSFLMSLTMQNLLMKLYSEYICQLSQKQCATEENTCTNTNKVKQHARVSFKLQFPHS